MLNPKVMVGECSIQVMLRGELLMTIPHRMWESGLDEEGEVVWSGELRGDQTTVSLVRFLEEKIGECDDRSELFDKLYEVLGEVKSPEWRRTLREEAIEKKLREEDKRKRQKAANGKRDPATAVQETLRPEAGLEEAAQGAIEWSKAA